LTKAAVAVGFADADTVEADDSAVAAAEAAMAAALCSQFHNLQACFAAFSWCCASGGDCRIE